MAKKSGMMDKEKLNEYKEMLTVSNRRWEKVEEKKWKRHINYYRNVQWDIPSGTISAYREQVTDNVIFSNIRTLMPAINFRRPKIFVKPKKKPYMLETGEMFDTLSGAVMLELVLNWYYKELEVKRQVDKCLMDSLLGFRGVAFVGYAAETEVISGDGTVLEINELIKEDSPYITRISPKDFRFDPSARDSYLTDARWIAVRWVKTLDEIKKNPKYKNTKDIKTNYVIDTQFTNKGSSASKFTDDGYIGGGDTWNRVEGWDIWDRVEQKIITIVEGHDKELRYSDWPLDFNGGFPVEILYFNENPDEPTPVSDIEIYINSQDELNRIRSLQLEHIKRISQRRYETREGALSPEAKRNLMYGGDGTLIESENGSSVNPIPDAVISQDIYIVAKLLKDSIREESGVATFEKGGAEKFDTATEAQLISNALNARRDERVGILEDFIKRIVSKLGTVIQQTLNNQDFALDNEQMKLAQDFVPQKIEKIIGVNNTVLMPWLNASKEDIQGEYNFEVEVGSTRPINQEMMKRDAMTLYQLLSQNPLINQEKNIKMLLEAFDVKETEELVRPMEQVVQEQQQSMQTAIQAEIAKNQPKRDADLQKTQMKIASQREMSQTGAKVSLLTAALQAESSKARGTNGKER